MKILRIIKAKYKAYTQPMPDWALERKKICDGCMFNSAYSKKKGLRYWFWSLLNFKNTFCEICKCQLSAKQVDPKSFCPAEPSKWEAID